jgi:ATP-dependent DNA helicase RecQ
LVYQALANYYSLAVGSMPESSLDFDIAAFSDRYNIKIRDLFNSLRRLEEAGLIQLSLGVQLPSRAMFKVDQREVYKFEIAHKRSEMLIKVLLRIYGGELYTHYVTIFEHQVARMMKVAADKVIKELEFLVQSGLLDYQQRKDKPQIIFTKPREDIRYLPVNQTYLDARKNHSLEKWEVMIRYFGNSKICRMRFIQRYFGEETDKRCGVCDICLKRTRGIHAEEEERYRQHIFEIVQLQPAEVEHILNVLDPEEPEQVIEIIRQMVDHQEIRYLDNWKLVPMNYIG